MSVSKGPQQYTYLYPAYLSVVDTTYLGTVSHPIYMLVSCAAQRPVEVVLVHSNGATSMSVADANTGDAVMTCDLASGQVRAPRTARAAASVQKKGHFTSYDTYA